MKLKIEFYGELFLEMMRIISVKVRSEMIFEILAEF